MSDSEMLKAAKAEVLRLEAELVATPTYQKLQLAKKVVDLWAATEVPVSSGNALDHVIRSGYPSRKRFFTFAGGGDEGPMTKTRRIEVTAVTYLKAKGARATSNELLEAMTQAGVDIGGAEPIKALSSYLSTSKEFNNVRELGGYGLAEWGNNRGPDLLTETGAQGPGS